MRNMHILCFFCTVVFELGTRGCAFMFAGFCIKSIVQHVLTYLISFFLVLKHFSIHRTTEQKVYMI